MANLDVSDVLYDPDFVDTTLVCLRRTQTVDSYGRAQEQTQSIPFQGVVTANEGDTLDVTAEGARVAGSITITTPFTLHMGGTTAGADYVQWQGTTYIIVNVYDYSTYGRGFVKATGQLKPIDG